MSQSTSPAPATDGPIPPARPRVQKQREEGHPAFTPPPGDTPPPPPSQPEPKPAPVEDEAPAAEPEPEPTSQPDPSGDDDTPAPRKTEGKKSSRRRGRSEPKASETVTGPLVYMSSRVPVELDRELKMVLAMHSREEGMTSQEIQRRAVEDWVRRHKKNCDTCGDT